MQVMDSLNSKIGGGFVDEVKLQIGNSPKDHRFDIVNCDRQIAIECKRYTWTESGNSPSAKIAHINEAVFYLSFLPDTYKKYVVMLYSVCSRKKEPLAEYYYRTYRHLLGSVKVVEYNPATDAFRVLPEGNPLEKELLYDEIAAAERQIANGEWVDGSAVFEELKRKHQA